MVDLLLPGEDLMPMVPANPNYYTDFVPLVRWQSTYNISPIIGTAAVFHGLSQPPAQPPNVAPSDPDISTPLFTMCLLHDINPNGAHIYCKTIDRFWQMRRDSGIAADGTKFVGYWYPNAAFKSNNKSILVSHYEPADGARRVVIIGNISKEPQPFTLQAPPGWRASLANARDAFTKEKVDASKPLELKKRGYWVIELSKPK